MIIDTSALAAMLKGEPEADRRLESIQLAATRRVSAANLLETYMVIDRSGLSDASNLVDRSLRELSISVEPVTMTHVTLARAAFHRFGRGSQQGAKLNFGDCFAYALAKQTGEPLLFIGNDFGKTDIGVA